MAYAEKHGRGWRARWRDKDGKLRSASGFTTRKAAEEYGRDREQGHPTDEDTAVRLLEQALFLRMNGERPPGAPRDDLEAETWHRWDRDTETFLRARLERLHPETREH